MASSSQWLLFLAGLLGAVGVGIGAMGAHSLPKQFEKRGLAPEVIAKKLDQCELGVRYQMIHVLAIAAIAFSLRGVNCKRPEYKLSLASAILFLIGVLCFSGGLYSIALADQIIHWSIVPIGGSTLIAAWLCLAISALVSKSVY